MSKIKTILSIIFIFTIWGCVSSAYPILWWSRECVLYLIIIIKPEVWIINHCLGLGHETMVCAVCLTMFLLQNGKLFAPLPLAQTLLDKMGEQHTCLSSAAQWTSIGGQSYCMIVMGYISETETLFTGFVKYTIYMPLVSTTHRVQNRKVLCFRELQTKSIVTRSDMGPVSTHLK